MVIRQRWMGRDAARTESNQAARFWLAEGAMDDLDANAENRLGVRGVANTSTTTEIPEEGFDDRLLALMEQWEEFYRRSEEPPDDWPGITDPVFCQALRDRIENQKRLYQLLELADTPADGAAADCEPPPTFPGHEILGEMGRGGMGVVYKARDVKLARIVAIKTLVESQHATREQLDRFLREAQAAARLHHPNILPIHAIGEHQGRPYISLEYADGGSLAERLAQAPMEPREAAALVETLARAVEVAHRAGIVHRDLKPSNVLLTGDRVAKVSDFGLAKLLDVDSRSTLSGQVLGTPSYMAPEQTDERSKQVGRAADVYGLGAVLYQALTGRPPFLGGSALETLKLLGSTAVVPPRQLRPEVPKDLETIVLKCLEKDPAKRYPGAEDLADDLRRFREGRAIRARRAGFLERSWRVCRRNPKVAVLSTLLGVSAILGVSVFLGLTYRHNIELRVEIRRTEAKATEARRNYQEARSAIQAMLNRLNDPKVDGVPRLLEVRRSLQEDALAFYDRILAQIDSNDPVVRADTAGAWTEASMLQSQLGHTSEAEKSVRRALQLIRSLRSEGRDDLDLLKLEQVSLLRQAAYLLGLGRREESILASRESVDLAKRIVQAAPSDLSLQERLALAIHNYATQLTQMNQASEAIDLFKEAMKIREGIDPQKLPGATQRLAQSHTNLGIIHWGQKEPLQAEKEFRRAEELLRSQAPDVHLPGEAVDLELAGVCVNWSWMLCESGRFDEAIKKADAGLDPAERHVHLEPNDALARLISHHLHGNKAEAFSRQGKHDESAREWARVIELSARPIPLKAYVLIAIELTRTRELKRALSYIQEVKSTDGASGEDCYNFTRLYSLWAVAARNDPSLPPKQPTGLMQSRIADAIRWLKAADGAGFFRDAANRDHAQHDPDLEILRDHPEFQAVVTDPVFPTDPFAP
jgi:tetratricopeptide (TPR) repeat protein/tRNA A-37 threonylcarbamoyl transferase component Bud32